MKYNDYLEQRNALTNEIQAFIDNGDLGEEYTAKCAEVTALDEKWDAIAQAQADLNALADNQRTVNVAAMPGVKVEDGKVTATMTILPTEQAPEDASSKAYENAWVKSLMGKNLDATDMGIMQKVNATLTTATTGAVVPTSFAQGIWDAIEKQYPLWADVTKTYVNGNYTIPVSVSSSDAAWYDEATGTSDGSETISQLSLVGCELARAITLSWKLREMAVEDFIPFIQKKLIEKIGAALSYGVADGKGKPGLAETFKPEPLGIITALEAEVSTPQVVEYTEGAMTYADLAAARSKVAVSSGLAFYANPATIWGELALVVDQTGRPIMVADPVNGGITRIFGIPVKADDAMTDGDVLLSAAAAGYIANVNKDMTLTTEDHAKQRTCDYCAYAIVDGGPTSTKCHAYLKGVAGGASGASGKS